ncbi:phage terminase, small subunit [Pseudomonas oryzihabitans]|nr:phage terminase, small subunit [Pseudomonas psychrotolerans]
MPPRSKVAGLPAQVKAWLDQALVESNFSGYEALSAELEARGYQIGKSALHRYGSEFEDKLAALKLSSEQAKAVVQAAPDDEGAVNEALMRLVQEHLFKLLMAEGGKLDLPKVAKAIAELGRASVVQKKWAAEVEVRRAALRDAASRVDAAAQARGLSAEEATFWREQVLKGM